MRGLGRHFSTVGTFLVLSPEQTRILRQAWRDQQHRVYDYTRDDLAVHISTLVKRGYMVWGGGGGHYGRWADLTSLGVQWCMRDVLA